MNSARTRKTSALHGDDIVDSAKILLVLLAFRSSLLRFRSARLAALDSSEAAADSAFFPSESSFVLEGLDSESEGESGTSGVAGAVLACPS